MHVPTRLRNAVSFLTALAIPWLVTPATLTAQAPRPTAGVALPSTRAADQPLDSAYTAQIRQLTPTDPRYTSLTDLVDHLPASATVPTPLKVLGYVPGTVGRLSHVADLNRYFRALAAASPRVKVFSLGMSDEGREMIAVAIADEQTIAHLDDYRSKLARLADPRGLDSTTRAQLVREAKPIYWFTGSIHSPETGSPEMLMEMAYRLAVEESDYIRGIRSNVITLITPVTEVDGRDREVDAYALSRKLGVGPYGVSLVYWGKYVAHDNNRDAMVLSQKLTQNFVKGFLHWHPTVAHDLHESVAFLYTSTGTGPYNEQYDPLVIDEWNSLAYQEITELTRRGLPGVWTHGFYDGWAPNYTVLSVANLHNSIGRFYETFLSFGAGCGTAHLSTPRETARRWDRPSPPINGVKWCIRSNINYQETASLVALRYVADNRATFLENFVAKSDRMIERGRTTAPYAYIIPRGQRHAAEAASLVNLFRAHAAEVQVADADFTLDNSARKAPQDKTAHETVAYSPDSVVTVHRGDWIVRMDQPYAAPVRTLLGIQHYKADDPPPYDDTGWTLDALRHVVAVPAGDSAVLSKPMHPLTSDAVVTSTISGDGSALLVPHLGDWRSAVIPWRVAPAKVTVADTSFSVNGKTYDAGTFIIRDATAKIRDALEPLGVNAVAAAPPANIRSHGITLPRIALVHTWIETQNEGWVRFALDQMRIPYTYVSNQTLRDPASLDRFDVVLFPHVSADMVTMVEGRPMIGPAIPWKKTALTPNMGVLDHTDDMRPALGFEGVRTLKRFVERGGLLITEGATSRLPIELGFTRTVRVVPTSKLRADGGVFRAKVVAPTSPVLYGYNEPQFDVYFNEAPVLAVVPRDTASQMGADEHLDPAIVAERERMRARVLLKYVDKPDSLLVSGLLVGGDELAGKAAVVDAPAGKGHVVMFGIRPLWRWESQGTFALVINAMANWNALSTNAPSTAAAVTSTH
jgi:hypothetical protein